MHELSICQALVKQVEHVAQQHNATSVSSISVAIGLLAGIEVQLLMNAFPLASAGTIAEQAELLVEQRPVRVKCNQCGAMSEVTANKLICQQCGDWQTTLISGDELMLLTVELVKDRPMKQFIKHLEDNHV